MKPYDNCKMSAEEADLEPAKLEDMPRASRGQSTAYSVQECAAKRARKAQKALAVRQRKARACRR